ncbi:hypothetical protein BT96DRAFT_933559 [Gymnopus androsaceus JB14]|uniref:Uncharacterized protein n=1 Tax=Gymnopus androsaceus JB14 TaxID=1447944 RepID=A0A6A4I956_9AGAR|nr:hypothetical protein BT96DRAFT_933559 [Gymnopus androsaceus JB14]
MLKISALILSAVLLTGASAKPLRCGSCNPNAQGNHVSVQDAATGLEWAVIKNFNIVGEPYAGSTSRGWNVPQTGEFPTCYFIELNASPGNILAEGCVIAPYNVSDACISIGPDAGLPLQTLGCGIVRANDEVYTIMT